MIKVNWHVDSKCNMNCRYCFCDLSKAIDAKYHVNVLNKLRSRFDCINFVGGEPTISPYLFDLLRLSKDLGFEVSIVTNGYKLIKDQSYFRSIIPFVSTIGISIDSLNPETNLKIGRNVSNNTILADEYIALCKTIKNNNIKLKINTVVSRLNINEDFNDFYLKVEPDKIKLLQVLKPNQLNFKHNYDNLLISQKEFDDFCKRHSRFDDLIFTENNYQMLNSYYILNSSARFKNDETGVISDSLLNCDINTALSQVNINFEKYQARYVY